ncbi:MAG: protease complex subunit PrcB family protein [Clostridium sp.]|uniref:protease complex subunit PrcB family protein n=1 Tax=Clostridium sp. TaxID=1506 RepID=UPI003D6CB7A1
MKSKIIIGLILTMSFTFKAIPVSALNSNLISNVPKQRIILNKINFEVISKLDAPQILMEMVNKNKDTKGFVFTVDDLTGYIYIAIMGGTKPTGGYSIEVTGVEDNEGKTNVFVKELIPAKEMMVTQVTTQPYTIIKAKGITPNIRVENIKDQSFDNLTMEKVHPPIGIDSMIGILKKIETVEKNTYATILDEKGNYHYYYSSNPKIVKDLKVSDKVFIKYVLGTPLKYKDNMAMPLSQISLNTFSSNIQNKNWKELKNYINVVEDKEWTIKFNISIKNLNFTHDTVYVLDSLGNKMDVELSVSYDKTYAKVIPITNYKSSETYYLFISKDIAEEWKNKSTIEGYRMMFTIRDKVAVE